MDHCRLLKFEQAPDYRYCIGLFESCMQRHSLDGKVLDFSWKINRLTKDKEALKNSMMTVLRKKNRADERQDKQGAVNSNHNANNVDQGYANGRRDQLQGQVA